MSQAATHPQPVYELLAELVAGGSAYTQTQDDERENHPTGVAVWIRYVVDAGLAVWHREAGNLYVLQANDLGGLAYELWKRRGAGESVTPLGPKLMRRTGRPRANERGADELVIAALSKWHEYGEGGSVGNTTPAMNRDLVGLSRRGQGKPLANNSLSRFLKRQKNRDGKPLKHSGYVQICTTGQVGAYLKLWRRELTPAQLPLNSSD